MARHPSTAWSLLKTQRMSRQQATYYADIDIIVDGWPWHRADFDFRTSLRPASENRRARDRRASHCDRPRKAA